ncbi:hypothetical protein WJX72_009429 [[Myrmecia] bisecta]|uniref:Uncharacterized protein n=1 Tax=[Myrmecia] bisecta TaxID=41462 RepID=A0AAW1PEU2_9CHLO
MSRPQLRAQSSDKATLTARDVAAAVRLLVPPGQLRDLATEQGGCVLSLLRAALSLGSHFGRKSSSKRLMSAGGLRDSLDHSKLLRNEWRSPVSVQHSRATAALACRQHEEVLFRHTLDISVCQEGLVARPLALVFWRLRLDWLWRRWWQAPQLRASSLRRDSCVQSASELVSKVSLAKSDARAAKSEALKSMVSAAVARGLESGELTGAY